jgi:acetyl esterase/lipase
MAYPDATQAASISPLAQLQAGNYHIPTFLIIGDQDEIVPFNSAVHFTDTLQESGVKSGFLPVPGVRHVHDVGVIPGTKAWELGVGPGYEFLIQQLEAC